MPFKRSLILSAFQRKWRFSMRKLLYQCFLFCYFLLVKHLNSKTPKTPKTISARLQFKATIYGKKREYKKGENANDYWMGTTANHLVSRRHAGVGGFLYK
jgi:hypothetical protein